jgi:hypothetical protein
MPLFGEAISKADYDRLIAKIKAHLEANAIPSWQVCCSYTVCPVPGCCWIYMKGMSISEELQKIGEEFDGARVELCQASSPSGLQAYDQYGQPLMFVFGGNKNSAGTMMPAWPPLGYNIILKAPKSFDLRSVWPGASQNAANIQIPAPMRMGPVTVAAR